MSESRVTRSVDETLAYAQEFSAGLRRGDVVALYGGLGVGKTQFVKGVCKGLHVRTPVTSPSFVFLNRYEGRDADDVELLVHHIDLYRIVSVNEVYELGCEELISGDAISLVEWADALGPLLPVRRYDVRMVPGRQECERQIDIMKIGEPGS
jgi:tRNA threonylcarbamoyladenosine biosynthesis protein TsaE